MKTKIEDVDQLIKDTLSQEEAKFYEDLEEQNLIQMVFGIFSGKNSWVVISMSIVQIIFFIIFIYSAIHFFKVETTNELIKWGIIGSICFMASSLLKIYSWMQMHRNATFRELKRLELQVSSLASKLSD